MTTATNDTPAERAAAEYLRLAAARTPGDGRDPTDDGRDAGYASLSATAADVRDVFSAVLRAAAADPAVGEYELVTGVALAAAASAARRAGFDRPELVGDNAARLAAGAPASVYVPDPAAR